MSEPLPADVGSVEPRRGSLCDSIEATIVCVVMQISKHLPVHEQVSDCHQTTKRPRNSCSSRIAPGCQTVGQSEGHGRYSPSIRPP